MKKLTLFLACAAIAATASAQLKVASNGQIRVGQDKGVQIGIGSGPVIGTSILRNDTSSTIRVGGKGEYDSGGTITFGRRAQVSIGESKYDGTNNNNQGVMILIGDGGINYKCGFNTIFSYDPNTLTLGSNTTSAFTFTKSLSAP